MEPDSSLPRLQVPVTSSYPKADQSSPHTPTILLKHILILSSCLCLGLPSDLFPSDFSIKACIHLYSPPYMLLASSISFFSIWSLK